MVAFRERVSLKPFNTFGIEARAEYFIEVTSANEVMDVLKTEIAQTVPLLVLGGGSNILFTRDFNGLVILNRIRGIELTGEKGEDAYVKAGSGEAWHELVLWCVENNLGGIENLSLIPGCVGAGPIQNIGAYGTELKNVFHELEAIHVKTGESRRFSNEECQFGYRESVFKNVLKGQYIITSVILHLSRNPVVNTTYGSIESELKKQQIHQPTIKDISNAVIRIRKSKLPDPSVLGNAGSFFKNPEIPSEKFTALQKAFPGLVAYPSTKGMMKLSAGWMIEQCGWKGKRIGNTGAHKDQALVLVNYGNASGSEIYNLASEIKKSVKDKFDVEMEMEVNIL